MKIFLVITLTALMVMPAWADMAPGYQRAAELRAVTDAAADIFGPGGEMIKTVKFIDTDRYEVLSENCSLIVNVVDALSAPDAPATVGPRQFEAIAENISC